MEQDLKGFLALENECGFNFRNRISCAGEQAVTVSPHPFQEFREEARGAVKYTH